MNPVLEYDDDIGLNDNICNDLSLNHRYSFGSVELHVGQTFSINNDLINVIK